MEWHYSPELPERGKMVIALVFNVVVLGKYVIDNAKKDKSKEE